MNASITLLNGDEAFKVIKSLVILLSDEWRLEVMNGDYWTFTWCIQTKVVLMMSQATDALSFKFQDSAYLVISDEEW